MVRQALTDEIWTQLQEIMKFHGCHSWSNDRSVMEAILWKLRTGAPWRELRLKVVYGQKRSGSFPLIH